jgi:hypothetical protein
MTNMQTRLFGCWLIPVDLHGPADALETHDGGGVIYTQRSARRPVNGKGRSIVGSQFSCLTYDFLRLRIKMVEARS